MEDPVRALLSVADRDGIADLARQLLDVGVDIVATFVFAVLMKLNVTEPLLLALTLVLRANLEASGEPGAVRWLDSRGSSVMVLEDNHEATIIWIPDGPAGENLSWRSDRVLG